MKKLFPSFVFLAVGLAVLGYNRTHTDRVLAFPFVAALVPSSAGNLPVQGRISGGLLMGLGALMLLLRTRGHGDRFVDE
jgi:hypothetical protein